ncbi:MAG: VCBS repeat-containing protein, partial [Bacteroidota bacterium]
MKTNEWRSRLGYYLQVCMPLVRQVSQDYSPSCFLFIDVIRTMRLIRIWLSLASIVLIGSACSDRTTEVVEGPIFQDLLSDRTGVTFENRLSPDVSSKFNLLDFDFYYNGSGIGIGDFNQDGLQDIFFAANEGPNELYINDGDFKFSNVSETANINADKFWASGVSIVDINEDGYPDIYISQGGPHEIDERGNVLLINNRDLTFTNQAEQYGLADQGISTQSAFFDYDQDGDLDCIVMNESLFYGYDPVTFHRLLLENPKLAYESYTHLYRNDGGQYQDVTRDAGISAATFGLGLCISDINEDGWLDIYIANDYYQPDNVYINRKDGTFADRAKVHLNHTSFYGMGVDIADINADGHEDILVLDMASKDHVRAKTLMASMDVQSFDLLVGAFGFVHQYMFNSLQLNDGKSRYKNVAQLANIASTDWSWAGLIQDYDLDGNHDILVTNGYRKYGTDNDFKNSVSEAKKAYKGQVPLSVKQELYDRMPSERISNLLFLQNGDFTFEERGASNGLSTPTFSNGAATADLDNDGDLDIVISNIDGPAQILNNTSVDRGARSVTVLIEESGETGAIVELVTSAGVRRSQVKSVRGYLSSVQPVAQFGLSIEEDPVSVSVSWPDGSIAEFNNVRQGARIEVSQKDALRSAEKKSKKNPVRIPDRFSPLSPIAFGIDFQHEENGFNDFETEVLLPYKQSSLKTALLASDLNGDSKDDLLFGGALGQPTRIYMSDGDTYQTIIMDDSSIETVAATTLDIDGDGDQDLILLAGGNESPDLDSYYQHRLYLNEGGTFIQDHTGLPDVRGVGGSVVSFDYDGDGDEDLMIGHRMRPQQYPVHGASIIFENDEGILRDVTATVMPDLMDLGIIN